MRGRATGLEKKGDRHGYALTAMRAGRRASDWKRGEEKCRKNRKESKSRSRRRHHETDPVRTEKSLLTGFYTYPAPTRDRAGVDLCADKGSPSRESGFRASGLPVGRSKGPGKSKLDKHRPEIEALFANGSTQKFIAKRYNSSPANLANWLKKRGIKKPKL